MLSYDHVTTGEFSVHTVIIWEEIYISTFHVKSHWSKPTLTPSVHPTCVCVCARACVRVCVCVCVGRGESAIIQLRIYVRSALTYASFHVTITVITMAASSTSTMPAMTPPTFVPESGEEGLVITFFTPLICVSMLQRSCNGLIQWGWIAKVCSLHNIFCLSTIRFTWTNHSCKPIVWWDANQSLIQRIINIFTTRKP